MLVCQEAHGKGGAGRPMLTGSARSSRGARCDLDVATIRQLFCGAIFNRARAALAGFSDSVGCQPLPFECDRERQELRRAEECAVFDRQDDVAHPAEAHAFAGIALGQDRGRCNSDFVGLCMRWSAMRHHVNARRHRCSSRRFVRKKVTPAGSAPNTNLASLRIAGAGG